MKALLRRRLGLFVLAACLITATRTIHTIVLTLPFGSGAADSPLGFVCSGPSHHASARHISASKTHETTLRILASHSSESTLLFPEAAQRLVPRDRLRWLVTQRE